MSQYGHLLPTQTYIANNKPQYVSVFDQATGGGGTLVSPVIIKSDGDRHEAELIVSDDNADLTISAVGNIRLVSEAEGVILGNNLVGGALVYVNGADSLGQVYDDVYHTPPTYLTIPTTIYEYNVPGNLRQITSGFDGSQLFLDPGTYSINAFFNNFQVGAGGTANKLDMYMVKNGVPGTIIPFSQNRVNLANITAGAGSFITMQSAVFSIPTSALYNIIFSTDGNPLPVSPNLFVSDNWAVQVVKWG